MITWDEDQIFLDGKLVAFATSEDAASNLSIAFNALQEDNARLLGLIKEAEWYHSKGRECAWCFETELRHTEQCPAFMPDGEVK